jgi:hypothetical protein
LRAIVDEEMELEGQKVYEAKSQMEMLIDNIKNSKFLNKREIKVLAKSKELTNKLSKYNNYTLSKSDSSPTKGKHGSGDTSTFMIGSKLTQADSVGYA